MPSPHIIQVALPTPVPKVFDYIAPAHLPTPEIGQRVRVPFGNRHMLGIVLATQVETQLAQHKLKAIDAVLEEQRCLPDDVLTLLKWASHYYRHPLGEVVIQAMPGRLRQGQAEDYVTESSWQAAVDASGGSSEQLASEQLARAPKQQAIYNWLCAHTGTASSSELNAAFTGWRPSIKTLCEKGLVEQIDTAPFSTADTAKTTPPVLNPEQREVVDTILAQADGYHVSLIQGITGSGKTEVYLHCIEQVIASGKQVQVLVPEIGLTPQLVERFRQRLNCAVGVAHSNLTDTERHNIWIAAKRGDIQVLIGTRSAVFTPFKQLGMIIIDEEHDASLKQHEGFRYHARDVAIYRARQHDIPIVLGSATPSLESISNCQTQNNDSKAKYQLLSLTQRAGGAKLPIVNLVDVRGQKLTENIFSAALLVRIREHLARGQQVLLFLNRRGFAPVLMCYECGWLSHCPRCDAFMTYHHTHNRLRCHHCDTEQHVPQRCPECNADNLETMGSGTERIEHALHDLFPDVPYVRIDRDTTRGKITGGDKSDNTQSKLDNLLQKAHSGEAKILVGTQMLAKGHDIPGVTFVGVLNPDQGFYSSDFRASERMGQLIVQVAGRAGRVAQHDTIQGEVMIQTHHPDNPLFKPLLQHDYAGFCQVLLTERKLAEFPPYSFHVLLRADAQDNDAPFHFLAQAKNLIAADAQHEHMQVEIYGPIPAPMTRRAGRTRAQLMCQANSRQALQSLLDIWLPQLYAMKGQHKVRWSVDVDPIDTF